MSQIVDIAANCDMSHIRYSMEKIALKLARCTISFVRKDSYIQEYFFFRFTDTAPSQNTQLTILAKVKLTDIGVVPIVVILEKRI